MQLLDESAPQPRKVLVMAGGTIVHLLEQYADEDGDSSI